jgi:hypothetical protein
MKEFFCFRFLFCFLRFLHAFFRVVEGLAKGEIAIKLFAEIRVQYSCDKG